MGRLTRSALLTSPLHQRLRYSSRHTKLGAWLPWTTTFCRPSCLTMSQYGGLFISSSGRWMLGTVGRGSSPSSTRLSVLGAVICGRLTLLATGLRSRTAHSSGSSISGAATAVAPMMGVAVKRLRKSVENPDRIWAR